MSQEVPCYLPSGSASIFSSLKRIVPPRPSNIDWIHSLEETPRLVTDLGNILTTSCRAASLEEALPGFHQRRIRRQGDPSSTSSADQPTVSVPTAPSSSTESASTPYPSLAPTSPSNEEPSSTFPPTNAPSTSDAGSTLVSNSITSSAGLSQTSSEIQAYSTTFSTSTSSSASWPSSSNMDAGDESSAPTFPPETSPIPVPPPATPTATTSDGVTITLSPILPSTISYQNPGTTLTPVIVLPPSSSITFDATSFSGQTSLFTSDPSHCTSNSDPTTTVFTTTLTDGRTSTVSTVIETGVLSTNIPKPSSFAQNKGAIIGVSLSATFVFILILFLIFFACKRRQSRRSDLGSAENILVMARETTWRPPLDGDDDDSYLDGYRRSHSTHQSRRPGSQGHSGENGYDDQGGTSVGDHRRGGGHGSSENVGMEPPMNPTFGGHPYLPGMGQSVEGAYLQQGPAVLPEQAPADVNETSRIWWGINDPNALYDEHGQPLVNPQTISGGRSRSAVSLTMFGGSSSGGHGVVSSSGEDNGRTMTKPDSLSGPRSGPSREGHRQSSSPPTAFPTAHDPSFDYERQVQRQAREQSDKASVKSFFSRLRNGRRVSTQSVATIRGPPLQTRGLDAVPNVYSPSLLNPPVTIPPAMAPIGFPRGATGNNYAPLSSLPSEIIAQDPGSPTPLWPPVTLPPPPSPVLTDNSSIVEGLLHPRLSVKLGRFGQASMTSLRDNEDYSRPINGLVNNPIRSTTTFETQDTIAAEDGRRTTGS